ncbi:MAG: group II intron maturase-specific domain-containing protein [Acidiferrobacteraceae bacterium]
MLEPPVSLNELARQYNPQIRGWMNYLLQSLLQVSVVPAL